MIQLVDISRQHGAQILFQDASFQILPGTRSGLVGPNGAGKTTIFRLITGEEQVDAGEIVIPKKTVIGYFSQDVGEMSGRSALEEVMAASGRHRAARRGNASDGSGHVRADGGRRHGRLCWSATARPRRSSSIAAATTWKAAPRPS